jgi:hypothetical protein
MFFSKSRKKTPEEVLIEELKRIIFEEKICSTISKIYEVNQISFKNESELLSIKNLILQAEIEKIAIIDNLDVTQNLAKIYIVTDAVGKSYLFGIVDLIELYSNIGLLAKSSNINIDTIESFLKRIL